MKKQLKIPKFNNEDEERDFWNKIDLSEFYQPEDFQRSIFPNLKPSVKTITIRLPENLLNEIKVLANKKNVPYQSFIKVVLDERIRKENGR